ncbi:hypothetical protein DFH07DRAFT_846572 [Mycena maculata]|uniref:F-box domain-containing protein n=1 Tax=Mycena maculata TaxID=230809 RepID=A0AAD7I0P2_9AGAR|nr:hypothetical protein DFH07DRAFT_846572 [Mycena maculata]
MAKVKASDACLFETPYEEILHTNAVPSDQECLRIRDLVVATMKERDKNAVKIAHLKAELDKLAQKEENLTEFIDAHLALVSPARRLPHDILAEIFTWCFPSNGQARIDPEDAPLLITHICREWRNLALSLPRLWASLHIELSGYHLQARIDEGVEYWLARSADLPLSISLKIPTHSLRTSVPLLDALMKYSHRWEHVRFVLPSFESYRHLRHLSPPNVPMLKTVVMDPAGAGAEGASTSLSFIRAQNITGIALMAPLVHPLDTLIPWHQLSHLSFPTYSIPLGEALTVLSHCQNLEVWTGQVSDDNAEVSPDLESIHMPKMLKVFLIDATTLGSTRLFEHLVLQNLECLECMNEEGTDWDPRRVLSSLCAPDKITSLGLGTHLSKEGLAESLRLFPMLQKLVLYQPKASLRHKGAANCELFALLTPSSPDPTAILCPELREIRCLGPNPGSDEQLLDLLRVRGASTDGVLPLSRVDIVFSREPQADIMKEVDVFGVGAGLTATLRYPTDEQLKFIETRRLRAVASKTARYERWPVTYEVTPVKRDDWGPISSAWVTDYEDWGRLDEVSDEETEPDSE